MNYSVASRVAAGDYIVKETSMAKNFSCDVATEVCYEAVQIFGGMGFCKELPIERYYRDARVYRIFDGASEIHRQTLARSALRRGGELFDIGAW
mgnify:CR=1 FL=1